jgi:WD40 repeat protein
MRKNSGDQPIHDEGSQIDCLAYSPSGTLVVGGTFDAKLFVWDSSGRHILGPIKGHGVHSAILHVSFVTESLILSTASDLTVRLWDAQSGERLKTFRKHEDSVTTAACLPDNRTIASVSQDGVVMLWDMDTLGVVGEFRIQLGSTVPPIVFSQDGTRLMCMAYGTGTVCAWDIQRGEKIAEVIFGCGDDLIRSWEIETGEMTGEPYEGHNDIPSFVTCSPNGKLIASATTDGSLHVWDIQRHKNVAILQGRGPMAISMDSRYLVHPGAGETVVIIDLSSVIKSDSSSLLDLPAIPIPQRSTANGREANLQSILDFGTTSRPHREGPAPEAESTKAGGRFSRIWKKFLSSRNNRKRQPASFQDKTPVRRSSTAAARDRNPVAIARGARRKENEGEKEKGQEKPVEQAREQAQEQPVDSEETPSRSGTPSTAGSSTGSESAAEEDKHDSKNPGWWNAWICCKMPMYM